MKDKKARKRIRRIGARLSAELIKLAATAEAADTSLQKQIDAKTKEIERKTLDRLDRLDRVLGSPPPWGAQVTQAILDADVAERPSRRPPQAEEKPAPAPPKPPAPKPSPEPAPKRTRVSPDERAKLRGLRAKGFTIDHIAELSGRSKSAVARAVAEVEADDR